MDQMHDELLKLKGPSSHQNGVNCSLVSSDEEDGWETVGRKNRSAVTRTQKFLPSELSAIFGGQLRSVVKARGMLVNLFCQYWLTSSVFVMFLPFSTFLDVEELLFVLVSIAMTLFGLKENGNCVVIVIIYLNWLYSTTQNITRIAMTDCFSSMEYVDMISHF